MKKFCIICVAIIMICSLASCGNNHKQAEDKKTKSKQSKTDTSKQAPAPMKGIILSSSDGQHLIAINPKTGKVTAKREFKAKEGKVEVLARQYGTAHTPFERLQTFDATLSRRFAVADVDVYGFDRQHIGWLDSDGNFDDLSAKLQKKIDQDSFVEGAEEPLTQNWALNYLDRNLYFATVENGKDCVYRSNYDKVSLKDSVSFPQGAAEFGVKVEGRNSFLNPIGTSFARDEVNPKYNEYFYELDILDKSKEIDTEKGKPDVFNNNVTVKWLTQDSYISARYKTGIHQSALYLCERKSGENFTAKTIVPFIENRFNKDFAVSPDNKYVVFKSMPGDGYVEEDAQLFIAYIDGSKAPRLLKVDPKYDLDDYQVICWSDGSPHPQAQEIKAYLNTPEYQQSLKEEEARKVRFRND